MGFYNVMLDFSQLFQETREFVQFNRIVARANPVGPVVKENLINYLQLNLQIIEQDGFLYVVD